MNGRSEDLNAFLVRFSDAVRGLAEPREVAQVACLMVVQQLRTQEAHWTEIDWATREYVLEEAFRVADASGVLHGSGRFPLDAWEPFTSSFLAGRSMIIHDARNDAMLPAPIKESLAAHQVEAEMAIPVMALGRPRAILGVVQRTARVWTDEEQALVDGVAGRCWAEIERARAEASLRRSEARYRTLVESVQDYAIYLLDQDGSVIEWTAGAERVNGYSAAEVIGRNVALLFTPEAVAAGEVEQLLAEAAATGRAEREGWRVRKGGERFWVNEVATSVQDALGAVRGFTMINRDLTLQKQAEIARERALARETEARREAERAMVTRDEFLAVVSHELRTPLSPILLWSKMLRAGELPPLQQARAFAAIEASALAQAKPIDDLLDISSMLSGKARLALCEVDIGSVLEAALATVPVTAEAKGVKISLDLGERSAFVRADPDRLRQVVWNLVNNAIKFTAKGGRVAVRSVVADGVVRIVVEDTGRGIAPDFLPHVFERFRQQDSSMTRSHGGLGLGLAIARHLVELHGGTVTAASPGVGRGATFTVELPLISHEPDADAASPALVQGSIAPGIRRPSALVGKRVLLVEDEPETRAALQWIVEQEGASVTAVASVHEALSAVDSSRDVRFDALISDLGLPDLDGYALLAALRERPQSASLPALALTAYARDEERERALTSGFATYLAKPVGPRALISAVVLLATSSFGPRRGADER